jgi:hypothetical protein
VLATFQTSIVGNVIHLHLPHSESSKLDPGSYAWDVQIADRGVPATYTGAWTWTTDTTQAAEDGQIGLGGAEDWTAAATINVNVLDATFQDAEQYLREVLPGDTLTVRSVSSDTSLASYTVSSDPTKVTNWWEFPVALISSSGGTPPDGYPTALTMPTAVITTLAYGSVTTSGEVTM